MEGNQLTFFITYMDREALLTLSEFDTVAQLKQEIELNFNIEVRSQDIIGWSVRPSQDNTILQVCCQSEFNCLQITNSKDETMAVDFDSEIEAITRLKEKVPSSFRIGKLYLRNAIDNVICDSGDNRNALLLYLHNSKDVFCHNFITYVHDEEIKSALDDSFLVLGWDLENSQLHDGLKRALSRYDQLTFVQELISQKIGAALCLIQTENNELDVIFRLNKHDTLESFKGKVRMVRSLAQGNDIPCTPMVNVSEIDAIRSLKRKLPSDISVTLNELTLDDALKFISLSSTDERKILFLYLHNSADLFSQMFISNLANGELPQLLNRSFLLVGWDVEDPKYHDALSNTLNRHTNLGIMSNLVSHKNSIGLCIFCTRDTISVCAMFRGKMKVSDMIQGLKATEIAFEGEMKDEQELKQIEDNTATQNELGSEEMQSVWADMLGDRDYDSFECDQHDYLKKKIAFSLFGPPQKLEGYDKDRLKDVDRLYKILVRESSQIAEFRDVIEVAFIYVCLEPLPTEKVKKAKKIQGYNPKTDVNVVPAFVLRKCRGSANPCRIFIDHNGRTYNSWQGFVVNNKYPKCEMIVPHDGRYTVEDGKVLLEKHLSPACQLDYQLLQVADIATGAAGVASGAVIMLAAAGFAALPVAPVVLGGAVIVGISTGIYAIGRSACSLWDRQKHKESMSLANSEARGAYLNIIAGTLGFVGAGANLALTQLVAKGVVIGKGSTMTVNAIQVLNLSASGVSLVNSGYEVIDQWVNRKQPPTPLAILQLGSSVLFFGHAVYNYKGAQTIVDETQAKVLQDYQDSLRSNRHRKTFNRLMRETMNNHNDATKAKAEVISAVRNIPNKDEVFAALTRNTKRMNKAGVKYSADGGKITFGEMNVDMDKFIGLKSKQAETFFNNMSQDASANKIATNQPSTSSTSSPSVGLKTALSGILHDLNIYNSSGGVNMTGLCTLTLKLLGLFSDDVQAKVVDATRQAVQYIFKRVAQPFIDEIDKIIPKNMQCWEYLRAGMSFFSKIVDEWEEKYQNYQKTRDQKYDYLSLDTVSPVYAKRAVTFFEIIVRSSFSGAQLVENVLIEISEYITAWITRKILEFAESKERENRRRIHSATYRPRKTSCVDCGGHYFQPPGKQ